MRPTFSANSRVNSFVRRCNSPLRTFILFTSMIAAIVVYWVAVVTRDLTDAKGRSAIQGAAKPGPLSVFEYGYTRALHPHRTTAVLLCSPLLLLAVYLTSFSSRGVATTCSRSSRSRYNSSVLLRSSQVLPKEKRDRALTQVSQGIAVCVTNLLTHLMKTASQKLLIVKNFPAVRTVQYP